MKNYGKDEICWNGVKILRSLISLSCSSCLLLVCGFSTTAAKICWIPLSVAFLIRLLLLITLPVEKFLLYLKKTEGMDTIGKYFSIQMHCFSHNFDDIHIHENHTDFFYFYNAFCKTHTLINRKKFKLISKYG